MDIDKGYVSHNAYDEIITFQEENITMRENERS